MDINVALENMRSLVLFSEEVAEQFTAIDEWLSKGGFLPTAWERDKRSDSRDTRIERATAQARERAFWYACGAQDGAGDKPDTQAAADFSTLYAELARKFAADEIGMLPNVGREYERFTAHAQPVPAQPEQAEKYLITDTRNGEPNSDPYYADEQETAESVLAFISTHSVQRVTQTHNHAGKELLVLVGDNPKTQDTDSLRIVTL